MKGKKERKSRGWRKEKRKEWDEGKMGRKRMGCRKLKKRSKEEWDERKKKERIIMR